MTISAALIVLAVLPPLLALPQAQPEAVALSADQAFAAADQLVAAGNTHDAEVLLRALSKDPSKQLRSEARFRLGRLRAAAGDYRGAITWYQAVLDEELGAAPVRLEMARTYARLGEASAAARELRRAQATRLPLDVARQVDRISAALRSAAPYGFDVSVGIAPDTNINRATAARTIDAQGLTFVIDRNGRATSGIGGQFNGRGYSRLPLGGSSTWLVEASGSALLYPSGHYNDVAAAVAIGPEFRSAVAQLRLAILASQRSFDGQRLSDQAGAYIEGRRNVGPTTQLAAAANATYARYPARAHLDGLNYSLSVAVEKAVTPRLFGLVGLSGARSDARDPAFASTSFGGRIFASRDAGRFTIFGGVSYQHLAGDAVFVLFQRRRRDDYGDFQLGASARLLAIRGLIPSVKFGFSQNRSTIPFYAFHRNRVELSLSRQF